MESLNKQIAQGKRLCDWCEKPIGPMWIIRTDVWRTYIKPEQWRDYICKRCWNKLTDVPKEHKVRW